MKKLVYIAALCGMCAFTACKQKHSDTVATPNSGTTGPTDTTKTSETGSPAGVSAQGQTPSLDTNHNIKAGADSVKK